MAEEEVQHSGEGIQQFFMMLEQNQQNMFDDAFGVLGNKGAYTGKAVNGQIYATGPGENINVTARSKEAVAFFQTKEGGGWTEQQAIGITANLIQESGLQTNKPGDGGQAYGMAQWHGDRRAIYAQHFGHRMDDPSLTPDQRFHEQLQFVNYELEHNEIAAGKALRNATSSGEAAAIFSRKDERPAAVGPEMAHRAAMARGLEQKMHKEPAVAITAAPTIANQPPYGPQKTADSAIIAQKLADDAAPKPVAKKPEEQIADSAAPAKSVPPAGVQPLGNKPVTPQFSMSGT